MYTARTKKSRTYRKRRYHRRSTVGGYANMAFKAFKLAKYLSTMINCEVKKYDVSDTVAAVDTTGNVIHLNPVAQGDTDDTRDGNSILSKSIAVKLQCGKHASATASILRAMLVVDTQQVADTAPTVADILDSTGNKVSAFLNSNSVGRFKILQDKRFQLTSTTLIERFISFGASLKGMHCRFNGTAGTDMQKNAVYLVLVSDEAANCPSVQYTSRYSFYDN